MRLILGKQTQPAPSLESSAIRHASHPSQNVQESAISPHPNLQPLTGPIHLPPSLAYPQLPSSFSSPARPAIKPGSKSRSVDLSTQSSHFSLANTTRPSAPLLSKPSISNPISIPQDPIRLPLVANRSASDTPALSHLTYLPINYAQRFKPAPKYTALEFIQSDRRHSPSYNPMKPSAHDNINPSGDILQWDGHGLQPADTTIVQPAQSHKTPPLRGTVAPTGLAINQAAAEKSALSFFKRPIRMMREKKGPPAPLMMNSDSLSIKPNETARPAPPSPPLIRPPKISNSRTQSETSKPSADPASLPLTQKAPSSSSTGSKLNSLLNAAARTIRTGDSRLFESFQAALSPRFPPESDKLPPPVQPWNRKPPSYSANSLKRIPVPAYNISEITDQSPISPRLTRATSFDRPKTATKHSRTSSMPVSQAPPALQQATPLQHPQIPLQEQVTDQIETVEKLSEVDEVEQPTYIPDDPTVNFLANPTVVLETGFDYPEATVPGPMERASKPELSVTGVRAHRSSSNLSYDDFREMVSRAMGSPLTVNHTISHRSSCLSQRESQVSHSLSYYANNLADERAPSRDSLAAPVNNANKSTTGFLQRLPSFSIQEAKRKSFQNMPLPPLPAPLSPEESVSKSNSTVNIEEKQTATFENIKKQTRPWTMTIPGSFGDRKELETPLPDLDPLLEEKRLVKGADLKHTLTLTASTTNSSVPKRKIRHSYPLRLIHNNPSPLERVSNGLYFPDSHGQTGKPVPFKFQTCEEIEYRQNDTSRLTPTLTSAFPNLMFGFRGEVYEVDKCEKPFNRPQSVKVPFDYDQGCAVKVLLDCQSTDPKLSEGDLSEKDSLVEQEDPVARSPGIDVLFGTGDMPTDETIDDQNAMNILPRIDPEPDELGQSIELKEICLIGGDNADDAKQNLIASNLRNGFAQEILIEAPSPHPLKIDFPTEHVIENLSMDRGSSEEESFRLPDESHNFELGLEPKIINPETSLEMAASILGQPVPAVSKEIWKGFERLHSLTEGRFMETEGKELREALGRLFEPGSQSANPPTTEVAVQTDPVAFSQRNDHFVLQPPCIIRRSSTRRVADALKKLANRKEQTELLSKENLPQNLTRHSFQSERSFVSASRTSVSSLQECMKSEKHDTPRTSAGTRYPWSERRPGGLSELVELRRFSSTRSRTPHSIHLSHFSPLRQTTGESNLSLRSHSPLTTSPLLTETVLDALDNALRAEETFQREKQHLQSVARRQSQTIESLLLDKEVLTLEVARLTGLVELLTRDHNLLNERIDKAEEAFDKIPSSKNQVSRCHSPEETACYCTATGETINKTDEINSALKQRQNAGKEETSFKSNGILTETDDGAMAGDSEDSEDEDEDEDDRDSLCDPEQGSIIQHVLFTSPRSPFSLLNSNKNQSPIPGSYPLLPTVPAL